MVSDRVAYSASMEPAYWEASPTFLNCSSKLSRFDNKGAMAATDSFPKNCVSAADCSASGKALTAPKKSRIAPLASTCIRFAISVAENPRLFNKLFCLSVAAFPAVIASIIFLIPVALISSVTPVMLAAIAAISAALRPAVSPKAPILVTTPDNFCVFSDVVFPK